MRLVNKMETCVRAAPPAKASLSWRRCLPHLALAGVAPGWAEVGRKIHCKALKSLVSRKENEHEPALF